MEVQTGNSIKTLQKLEKYFLLSSTSKLFTLLFVLPFIVQVSVFVLAFISGWSESKLVLIMPMLTVPLMVIDFLWIYTLGTNLFLKLEAKDNLSIKKFKFNIFYLAIYGIVFLIFSNLLINAKNFDTSLFGFFIILHFYAMYCIFYTIYFISKSLASIEVQRSVKFEEYISTVLTFLFLPLGIWVIQPKIKKIFSKNLNQ